MLQPEISVKLPHRPGKHSTASLHQARLAVACQGRRDERHQSTARTPTCHPTCDKPGNGLLRSEHPPSRCPRELRSSSGTGTEMFFLQIERTNLANNRSCWIITLRYVSKAISIWARGLQHSEGRNIFSKKLKCLPSEEENLHKVTYFLLFFKEFSNKWLSVQM